VFVNEYINPKAELVRAEQAEDEERSTILAAIFLHEGFEAKVRGSSGEHINEHVNPTMEVIISAINRNPKITNEELIALTGKSRSTITRSIKTLRESGLIYRIGSNKDGYWATKR
jgi:predicted HTH transcriptional regulator